MADDILKEALEAFEVAEARERSNRDKALDDLKFARLGEEHQWPDRVRKQREREGRPCLTINKMPSFIRQVVNDSRQNKPAISVHPVETGDVKTAEIIGGLIRNIEVTSNADVAYDTAVEHAVTGGFGYIRVNLDYARDDSFDKDIVIKAVPNQFSIYGDPYSQGADSADWMSAFVTEELPVALFKRKYPKADAINFESSAWSQAKGWCDSATQKVRVAEYWKRDEVVRQLIQYTHDNSGEVLIGYEDELPDLNSKLPNLQVIGSPRPVKSYKVKQYTLNGLETLNEVDWVGRYIPIIPVYGDEVNVQGERHFLSLIRHARDPQRMFNYWRTMATELVALAPKAPFIGKKGSFKSDPRWNTAHNASHAYLEFDGDVPPQRQPFNGVPAGELQEALNASDDMKAVMGIYDASLGARSNETSGRAIMARQHEGDVSTFHFVDNLSRAIRHTGRVVVDLIPHVYNSERVIRTLGEDGKPATVKIANKDEQPNPQADPPIYNLTMGKYDVTVKAGASYTTQREQALDMLTNLVQANGEVAPLIADVIVELMDIPGGEKIVNRLQAVLPAPVKQAEEGQNPEMAAARQQIEHMQSIIQEGMAHIAELEKSQGDESRKTDIEAYRAATERLQALAGLLTPEMIMPIVASTEQDLAETAMHVPEDVVPHGNPMPTPGEGEMPQMEPQGQPGADQL